MSLSDALAEPDCTSLKINLAIEAIDDRVLALTKLERLTLANVPDGYVLPLRALPDSAVLFLEAPRGQIAHHVDVSGVSLQALDVTRVDLATLEASPALRRLTVHEATSDDVAALPRFSGLEVVQVFGERVRLPDVLALPDVVDLDFTVIVDHVAGLAGCPRLQTLEFMTVDGAADLRALAEARLPLRTLRLRAPKAKGAERATVVIPPEIGQLPLSSLVLMCAVEELPEALAQCPLRTLTLCSLPTKTIPEVVGRLPLLETLIVRTEVNTLPASLEQARSLRKLDLDHALNHGAMISRFDDVDRLKPLPRVLQSLVGLEALHLDCCGVFDLTPLSSLTKLKVLTLSWSGVSDLTPLSGLTALEELRLEHLDRARDLSPLGTLKALRVLNLDNARVRSLDVLRELPALQKLHIEAIECRNLEALYALDVELEADDEVKEKYAQRAGLRALPPIGDIVARVASDDAAVAGGALDQLATWTLASSTRDQNAITVALGLEAPRPAAAEDDSDDDEEDDENEDEDEDEDEAHDDDGDDDDEDGSARRTLPVIDAALARHGDALSPAVLARVFAALFQGTSDNFEAALTTARSVVARGDDAAQRVLVEAFKAANAFYDTGHRMWEATVQDMLCDEVLGGLGGPALAELVCWCSDGHLGEDGMTSLLGPALDRAVGDDRARVLARIEKHVAYRMRYSRGHDDGADAVLAGIVLTDTEAKAAFEALRIRLAAQLEASRRREALEAALKKTADPAGVRRAIDEIAAIADTEERREYVGALWRANHCTGLDEEGLRALLALWRSLNQSQGVREALALAVRRDPTFARALAAEVGLDGPALQEALRGAIVDAHRARVQTIARIERSLPRPFDDDDDDVDEEAAAKAAQEIAAARATFLAEVAPLRTWLKAEAHVDDAGRQSIEVLALFDKLGRFERDALVAALEGLAEHPGFIAPPSWASGPGPRALAGDIGQLVGDEDLWPLLMRFARDLSRLGLGGQALERVLAQLIAVAIRSDDDEGCAALIRLVPEPVTWDILAFNLACLHAIRGEREGLLRFTKRSLELGKSPAQFQGDDDFSAWLDDEDFATLLRSVE